MDDSIVFLDESSKDSVKAKTSRGGVSSDEDEDFFVPLPKVDNLDEGEDFVPQKFTQIRKRKADTKEKDAEKEAAAEKRAQAKALKLAQQEEKKAIAEKKKNERLQVRLAKESEKLLKKQRLQATRARQPKSLIKTVVIVMDNRIRNFGGDSDAFQKQACQNLIESKEPVALEFLDAQIPYSITWKLPESGDIDPIISSTDLVIVLPVVEFINLVHGSLIKDDRSNLLSYFREIKEKTRQKTVHLIILGLDGYRLNYKTLRNRQFRQQFGDNSDTTNSMKGLKTFDGLKSIINPDDIDRSLIDLQMTVDVSHLNAVDMSEVAVWIQHLTKALVEKPEKKRKLAIQTAIGWQELGSFKAVKVGEDGSGRRELWKRMVMQGCSRQDPKFADAVVGKYGNSRLLIEAYRRCENVELARNLLSQVDEGGNRKYEASRRVHMAFTSRDPNQVIDRDK